MTPQPLHIFRKDITHLWPEILAVLALFVAFAAAAPSGWANTQYAPYVSILAGLLHVLMPISWIVLISRVIHDEPLVGDRQFWTSRPYHWAQLFAAKILFLIAFIYLPFFLMQCYLLKHAGLHPMVVLPALGHNLLLLTVSIIVPVAAIAAVTSTFVRLMLSILGGIVLLLILLGGVGYATFLQMQVPHLDWLLNSIFILLPLAALILQYSRRKTSLSRWLLVATPVLAALIVLIVPRSSFISGSYPAKTGADTPKLAGMGDLFHPPAKPTGKLITIQGHVPVGLPIKVDGVAEDTNYIIEGTRATLDGAGVKQQTPFQTAAGAQINGATPATLLTILLPQDVFNKVHTTPVDLHLEMAARALKAGKPSTWKATLLPFAVPGNGLCTFSPDDASQTPTCRYPLAQPEISFVTAQLAAGSCSIPAAPPRLARASVGGKAPVLDFDPVVTVPLAFQTGDQNPQHNYLLCPGTDLKFVSATDLPNAMLSVDLKQIVLDAYASRSQPRDTAQPGQPEQPQPSPNGPPRE